MIARMIDDPEPLPVSYAFLSAAPQSGRYDRGYNRASSEFMRDPEWVQWWNSLNERDDVFAVIYVEERTKRMHRVTRSRHGISISLGIPVRQALEAADPDTFFREQMYDLWHRGATKLGWPTPPERMPGQEANA